MEKIIEMLKDNIIGLVGILMLIVSMIAMFLMTVLGISSRKANRKKV
jgi:DMSO/TMAO reductase YedYZ heme-binding membrane subunit